MAYRALANLVLITHLAFVLFAGLGGFLVLRWSRLAWLHLPACLWGALVELTGWVCPLTPLENWLRQQGGGPVYRTGFIEHYLLPLLYPDSLTRSWQIFLGLLLLSVNLGVYGWIFWRIRQNKRRRNSGGVTL
jgi:hypothetical protein